ncbi:hypothetical protein CLLI_23910 [Clostridium liquoris]|jgi:hypothetical protein|uniref:Uncharacterized protein n=1 Tax=Clostridium liquoris TaxID=1289519 RepID=A0A2T0B0T1_9CLOT|nr:hypothetical protein [Clostridium liquoris]PRR77221.1 hypothetical protein CLLI_23910 [Clostridium liquoris]
MKDFNTLKFLDKFKYVFQKLGINYEIMRKILQIKLIMDGRRAPTIINNSNKKEKDDDNKFMKSLWMYSIFGIFLAILVVPKKSIMMQMSIFFGILMFMLITTLISDFSSVLLDARDKNIMLTKPVDSKTINAAKVIHVFIYMFYITIAMTGIALLVSLRHGVKFFIVLVLEIILIDIFMIVLTSLIYLLILKFFDGEKLKDIINYVQIILIMVMTIGYQFIGRLFEFVNINVVFTPKWWQYLIIPVWFAAPLEMILNNNYNIYIIILSTLGIVVPIASLLFYIKLSPVFERNLQKLNNNTVSINKNKAPLGERLCNVVCWNREERIFFKFAYKIIRNEREFKLKVYPSLGLAIVFPFIFMFGTISEANSFNQWLNYMVSTKYYLNIYWAAFIIPTLIMMMKYSGRYKAAWIYKVMPIKEVAPIFKGTIKAFFIKLIAPLYIIESIIFIFIFGIKIFPHLLIVFLNILLFTVLCFKIFDKSLPFSKSFQVTQTADGIISIFLMLLLAALAGIHYFSTIINFNVYVYMFIMLIIVLVFWRKSFNISWEKLK